MSKFICDEQSNCGDSSSQEIISGPLLLITYVHGLLGWPALLSSLELEGFLSLDLFLFNFYFKSEYI